LAGKPLALTQIEGLTMNKSIAIAITGAVIAVAIVLTDYWLLVRARQAALGNAMLNRWTASVLVCERPDGRACRNW
jgi:hypothetical protein